MQVRGRGVTIQALRRRPSGEGRAVRRAPDLPLQRAALGVIAPRTRAARARVELPAASYRPGEAIRVLVVPFAAREEGIEAYCDYLARGMPDGAVEWSFAVWQHQGELSGRLLAGHGDVVRLNADPDRAWTEFRELVRGWRPHLVHVHHRYGAIWGRWAGLPVVATVHGIREPHSAEFYGADLAELAVNVSPACCPADVTVLSGIVPVEFPARRIAGRVAWCGRIEHNSGVHQFLDAVSLVPELHAIMMGRSVQTGLDVRGEIARYRLEDRVEYLGHLPAPEARAALAECDGMVVCCQHSFGFAMAEAMTAGVLPVTVPGVGYQATMASPWGYVAQRDNVAGLAQALQKLLNDDEREHRRVPMSEHARRLFDARAMAREYLQVYQTVLMR